MINLNIKFAESLKIEETFDNDNDTKSINSNIEYYSNCEDLGNYEKSDLSEEQIPGKICTLFLKK